jgi:hypothetical protein
VKQADLGLTVGQLEERQEWLQDQARSMMSQLHFEQILTEVGEVRVVGSAETRLMVWPDLDLEVLVDDQPSLDGALKVIKRLMTEAGVVKINLADHRQAADQIIPNGIYVGPTVAYNDTTWQVDIWFLNKQEAVQRSLASQKMMFHLDEEKRRIILQLKQKVAASDKYHRGVSSVDLYAAVLHEEVQDY